MQIAASLPKRAVAFFSAAVLAVSMVCAVPFTAQAADDVPDSSGYVGTIKATGQVAEVAIGDTIDMHAGEESGLQFKITTTAAGDSHVDYSVASTGDGGAATINKHSGVLTPSAAGTVTVTAYLLDCAQPSQIQSNPCFSERVISTATKTVTITPATTGDYGWQGNALQIKLDNESLVAGVDVTEDGDYINTLNTTFATNSAVAISYSQSNGIGNRTVEQYASDLNAGKITLVNSEGTVVRSLATDMFMSLTDPDVKTGITLAFDTVGLPAGDYSLVFDSEYVAGNNTSKLGSSVSFNFELV